MNKNNMNNNVDDKYQVFRYDPDNISQEWDFESDCELFSAVMCGDLELVGTFDSVEETYDFIDNLNNRNFDYTILYKGEFFN